MLDSPGRGTADFLRTFAIGFAAALVAAGLSFFVAPKRVFVGSRFAPQGIRLFRDDYELGNYMTNLVWMPGNRFGAKREGSDAGYPPLGTLLISLPRFFSKDLGIYTVTFLTMMAASFAGLFAVTATLLDRFGMSRRRLAFFFLPAFMYFSLWRYDTFPSLLVMLAVLGIATDRLAAAGIALWGGTMAKLYPALFFAPYLHFASRPGDKSKTRNWLGVAWGFVVAAAVTVAAMLATGSSWTTLCSDVFRLQMGRTFEPGALPELFSRILPVVGADGQFRLAMKILFVALQYGPPTLFLVWHGNIVGKRGFVRSCIVLLIPFMVFGQFFSQQWVIWLTPLYLLVADRFELALLVILDVVLFLQFPVLFDVAEHGLTFDLATVLRTTVLLTLWIVNYRLLAPPEPAKKPEYPHH